MSHTKLIIVGAFFTSLAVVFQIIPVILSEAFVLTTMLSALPIYVIGRINPKIGAMGYVVATILIMIFSVHEGLFFLCTNGIVGLSLGSIHHYTDKKFVIFLISAIAVTGGLSVMNFIIGIPIFGFKMNISISMQLFVLFVFSMIYSIIYFYVANFVYKMINSWS